MPLGELKPQGHEKGHGADIVHEGRKDGAQGGQGQKAADQYINAMLKGGSSAPPLELLKNAGVDLEKPDPILTMLDLFENTVEEFDALWTKTYDK